MEGFGESEGTARETNPKEVLKQSFYFPKDK